MINPVYSWFRTSLIAIGLISVAVAHAHAQDIGTVAAASGVAEATRAGTRIPVQVGTGIQLGDELRTGDGEMRVVFQDDSVLDLSENSALVVDEQVFNPEAGRFTSLMRLLEGKVRTLVSSYYGTAGAVYEVETPTAVAGVRGTSFMVQYDPERDATEVVGIRGQIGVRSLGAQLTEVVYVSAREATTVPRGQAPSAPRRLDELNYHREIEGLEVLGLANLPGIAASNPIRGATTVPVPDQAPGVSSNVSELGRDELRNPGDVLGQPLGIGATRGRLGVPF